MASNLPEDITFLMVPGLRDHVEDHWQTHLQKRLQNQARRAACVEPLEHDKLSRAARVQALEEALASIQGPVVLVAHSAGVITCVHWAQQHSRSIHGALLVTPADVESLLPQGYPTQEQLLDHGWCPVPRNRLPFKTIVAASRNDPLAAYERMASLAADWGAELADLGRVGHLNPAAGYGPWAGAEGLLGRLV